MDTASRHAIQVEEAGINRTLRSLLEEASLACDGMVARVSGLLQVCAASPGDAGLGEVARDAVDACRLAACRLRDLATATAGDRMTTEVAAGLARHADRTRADLRSCFVDAERDSTGGGAVRAAEAGGPTAPLEVDGGRVLRRVEAVALGARSLLGLCAALGNLVFLSSTTSSGSADGELEAGPRPRGTAS